MLKLVNGGAAGTTELDEGAAGVLAAGAATGGRETALFAGAGATGITVAAELAETLLGRDGTAGVATGGRETELFAGAGATGVAAAVELVGALLGRDAAEVIPEPAGWPARRTGTL
jgi:hypothetical protein